MSHSDVFKIYLNELRANLAGGIATEHTYRPALERLIESLEPGIQATNEPARIQCGAPDFIVTRGSTSIGYIEAKDIGVSLHDVERSDQLHRYRASLNNLILTDYLEFRWYVNGDHRETARLATVGLDGSLKTGRDGIQGVAALLQRFLAEQPPAVGQPRELAQRMATLARLVRDLITETFEREGERGQLHAQLHAFRAALIPDLQPEQFADMYAQTIAYGLFAARVHVEGGAFTRQHAAWNLPRTNPFLRNLFSEIAGPGLDDRIAWLVDDLAQLLARADMGEILRDFGRRTRQEDAVVHFYETFLAAYDPSMRKTRGVYYTPEPVVSYIVRSIAHLLKTRFDRPLGLADPTTLILDPAAGTATFLYFVVQHIYDALVEQGQQGGWNDYVAQHLLPRLFGFELLMAPYAIAHMKLGILLQQTGYAFQGDQRLGVYLTNTLEEAVLHEGLPGFGRFITEEANAAAEVKRDKDILVVLGNPPYAGHSANRSWEMRDGKRVETFIGRLLRDYYRVDGRPLDERNPKWLQDDYVKFIRWGQWRIERTGQGILAFITNHGYLDNPTFRGMRQSLMQTFSDIYLLDLHGNAKKKETAPDGGKDENVFDIQQGVAVALFVKRLGAGGPAAVHHADLWGVRDEKYPYLFAHAVETTAWQPVRPQSPFYLFAPQDTDLRAEYERAWKVTDAMPVNVLGFQTHRDAFAMDFDREQLRERMQEMRGTRLSDAEFAETHPEAGSADWNLRESRETLRRDASWERRFIRCAYRPFDWRWGYYDEAVMDRPRRELKQHVARRDNRCLNTMRQTKMDAWQHAFVSDSPTPAVFVEIKDGSSVFPLYLYPDPTQLIEDWQWPAGRDGRRPNLAPAFVRDVEAQQQMAFVSDGRGDMHYTFGPEDVFHYLYAVLHSPTFRQRYAEFLKIDFPRVPLTSDRELFRVLAEKGARLVALHLLESPLLSPDRFITTYPVPGDSEVVRVRYAPPGQDAEGKPTPGRVYINTTQYFEGIPPEVWAFRIGGYQVLEKWLKDRRGRRLTFDDLMHYQKVVVALKETMRLMEEIDAAIPGWPME